jgi:hypothetical protein
VALEPLCWCPPDRGKINAHHCLHWCDGGPTDLTNMVLLCARHHTTVHQKGYTATIDAFGARWHL